MNNLATGKRKRISKTFALSKIVFFSTEYFLHKQLVPKIKKDLISFFGKNSNVPSVFEYKYLKLSYRAQRRRH